MKIILVAFATTLLCSVNSYSQSIRSFPEVNLKNLNGEQVSTNEIQNNGKPILIIVWATWCHHSVDGMTSIADDYLDDWVEEFGLKVVGISVDDARNIPKVGPMVNGNGWEYEIYLDPNADFKRAMGVNQPPHLFILNGNREVVWSFNGFNSGDEEEIQKVLDSLKN